MDESWQWQSSALCALGPVAGVVGVRVFTPALNHGPLTWRTKGYKSCLRDQTTSRCAIQLFNQDSNSNRIRPDRARGRQVRGDWQLDSQLAEIHFLYTVHEIFYFFLYHNPMIYRVKWREGTSAECRDTRDVLQGNNAMVYSKLKNVKYKLWMTQQSPQHTHSSSVNTQFLSFSKHIILVWGILRGHRREKKKGNNLFTPATLRGD